MRTLDEIAVLIKERVKQRQAKEGRRQEVGELLAEAERNYFNGSGVHKREINGRPAWVWWSDWLRQCGYLSQWQAHEYIRYRHLSDQELEEQRRKEVEAAAERKRAVRREEARERRAYLKVRKADTELMMKMIDRGYRSLAREYHPDTGGSHEAMLRLGEIRDQLRQIVEYRP
jgi:hypothetical protein